MSRTEFGFSRSVCACRRCAISCEHVPGALAPGDVERMAAFIGAQDVFAFARDHLLASEGVAVVTDRGDRVTLRTLVPATEPDGSCKFLKGGRCTIHEVSPFGCAFIDAHQSDEACGRMHFIDRFTRTWSSGGTTHRFGNRCTRWVWMRRPWRSGSIA
ncbi:MAG TPA: hypothetical protein VF669_00090 [Tepidisphaeraceae bacterium]